MMIMRLLIKCCLPFSIVEHPGFIEYHQKLDPSFKIPTRKTISYDKLTQLRVEVEDKIKRLFANEALTINTSCTLFQRIHRSIYRQAMETEYNSIRL